MKTIILKRLSHVEMATFGVFIYNSIPFCLSLELPWRDNMINKSCIPEGTYAVSQTDKDEAFEVLGVPGRTGIQIEIANTVSQLRGCIAVGEKYEPLGGEYAVHESRLAFLELKRIIKDDIKFLLKIIQPHRNEYLL